DYYCQSHDTNLNVLF
nr:immunoglobulin light chain junction region [Macaca mulatta]